MKTYKLNEKKMFIEQCFYLLLGLLIFSSTVNAVPVREPNYENHGILGNRLGKHFERQYFVESDYPDKRSYFDPIAFKRTYFDPIAFKRNFDRILFKRNFDPILFKRSYFDPIAFKRNADHQFDKREYFDPIIY
ncbi:hypothetical protein EWB00_010141 [Schistosoma japonicum]|uniref:SJCHGC06632 protein n=1 Tax=Schistosoma japonicum TaxID=6182 RepID=Q86EM3_SCHJA|nr:SJCHGC06632 protein [Schistosoma japonicum]KAH8851204.1 hypothetical protein KSF78_0000744 [Schistosoma japonicum]TNN18513.1 hypothetical protein EWB00_010141 [Schistosoma japonicum]